MARLMTVAALLLTVVLVAGCGDSRSAARKAMDAKFDDLDYRIATRETIAAESDPGLEKMMRQYVALVRRYADLLGPAEARKRLIDKGDDVGPYCLPCSATLYDAAKKY